MTRTAYRTGTAPDLDPNWRTQAACRDADPNLFWPATTDAAQALAYCDKCPVVWACAEWATATQQTEGVWGGRLFGAVGKCRHAGCTNPAGQCPDHQRGPKRRDRCDQGHEFAERTVKGRVRRYCRVCKVERMRARRAGKAS